MLSTATAAVVNIVFNFLLIPSMGIWGAVIGTLIAYITIAFFRLFDVKRFVAIDVKWQTFLPTILILVLQAVAVSLDYHIYACSAAAVVLYFAINFKDILFLTRQIMARLAR